MAIVVAIVTIVPAWIRQPSFLFQLIRKRVRIPLRDDFLASRIAGPGLASRHYYQIRPEQALATLQARMDRDMLASFRVTFHWLRFCTLSPGEKFLIQFLMKKPFLWYARTYLSLTYNLHRNDKNIFELKVYFEKIFLLSNQFITMKFRQHDP